MIRILAAVLAFFSMTAMVVTTDTPVHDLYRGSILVGTFPTHDACVAAAVARNVSTAYECRVASLVTTTVTPDWIKIVPEGGVFNLPKATTVRYGSGQTWVTLSLTGQVVCANATFSGDPTPGVVKECDLAPTDSGTVIPTPASETLMVTCPAGSVTGAQWKQTRDYAPSPSPVFWSPQAWTPTAPQAGTCPPAVPPVMHSGWPIDPASVDLTVVHGVRELLIDPVGVDCKTAADKVPGCNWPGPSIDGTGAFRNVAYRAKLGWFDPIVHPGEDNTAHLHQFFGNVNVNKDSTSASLLADCESTFRGGSVSCSAVWTPVMVDTKDNTVRPGRDVIVYYKNGAWTDGPSVQAVPIGLKMVIGGPSATSYTRWGVAGFSCDGIAVASDSSEPFTGGVHRIPTLAQCGVGHEVWMTAVAANCWDGVNLYKTDGSHMAYPKSPWTAVTQPNGCEPDHPILLPQVAVLVITTIGPNDDPGRWVLSSDKPQDASLKEPGDIVLSDGRIVKPGASMHADYFGAIPLDIQKRFLDGCIHPLLDCQAHMMGDGHTMRSFGGN